MKLKELLDVCWEFHEIELHSSRDGSLVATKRESLEKYGEVEVKSIYPKMKMDKTCTKARPYLYVYGSSVDIDKIRGLPL